MTRRGMQVLAVVAALAVPAGAVLGAGTPANEQTDDQAELTAIQDRLQLELDELERQLQAIAGRKQTVTSDLSELCARVNAGDRDALAALDRTIHGLWRGLTSPKADRSLETQARLQSVAATTAELARLTPVMQLLSAEEREPFWALLEAEPNWVADVLSDDLTVVTERSKNRPAEHEGGAELVLSALVADRARAFHRLAAVEGIDEVTTVALRRALIDTITVTPDQRRMGMRAGRHGDVMPMLDGQVMTRAAAILKAAPWPDMAVDLMPRFDRQSGTEIGWRLAPLIAASQDLRAIPGLLDQADDAFVGVNGWSSTNGITTIEGDAALWIAAGLLGVQPFEFGMREIPGREGRFGFPLLPVVQEAGDEEAGKANNGNENEDEDEMERLMRIQRDHGMDRAQFDRTLESRRDAVKLLRERFETHGPIDPLPHRAARLGGGR